MLGYHFFGLTNVQYWRSFEHLERFAADKDDPHASVMRQYWKRVGKSARSGIWHETFLVRAGEYEAIYGNMPPTGLGQVRRPGPRERLLRQRPPQASNAESPQPLNAAATCGRTTRWLRARTAATGGRAASEASDQTRPSAVRRSGRNHRWSSSERSERSDETKPTPRAGRNHRWSSSERSERSDETRFRTPKGSRNHSVDSSYSSGGWASGGRRSRLTSRVPVVVAEELVAVRARPQERPGFEHRVGPARMRLESMVTSTQRCDVVARGGAALGVGDDVVGVGLAR